jgi:hypothetical protein
MFPSEGMKNIRQIAFVIVPEVTTTLTNSTNDDTCFAFYVHRPAIKS